MIVEKLWTGNSLRNFNYLIACSETGDALAIDPLDYQQCLDTAKKYGWQIRQIVNTHEHGDHIGGNKGLINATGAKLIAHKNAGKRIPNVDRGVGANDIIRVGNSVELRCLDTPGHTMSHICLLADAAQPALFSGDTLFNAGAGNCHNGGHPEQLFDTFEQQLTSLGEDTALYPGHDYLINNLEFALDREPSNVHARQLLKQVQGQDPADGLVTTLGQERLINPFFRLEKDGLVEHLVSEHPELGDNPSAKTVFLKLRELRNRW